jgi:hypothetical protein
VTGNGLSVTELAGEVEQSHQLKGDAALKVFQQLQNLQEPDEAAGAGLDVTKEEAGTSAGSGDKEQGEEGRPAPARARATKRRERRRRRPPARARATRSRERRRRSAPSLPPRSSRRRPTSRSSGCPKTEILEFLIWQVSPPSGCQPYHNSHHVISEKPQGETEKK